MLKKKKTDTKIRNTINFNLEIPSKNESVFFIEDNGVSIFDYLLLISEKFEITDCSICSFRISKRDLSFLEELISLNKLPKTNLLLSDSIPSMVVGTFNYLCDNPFFKTTYINTHAKYTLINTKCGNYFCVFSSGNFNPDGKLEQLTILNNKDTYDFFKKFNVCQAENQI
jgi:hypothetical protein